jgi:hypothetical protein
VNETRAISLLVDIAKLLRRHGPESFDDLARLIDAPEFRQTLMRVLSATATAARAKRADEKVRSGQSVEQRPSLPRVPEDDPAKFAVLSRIEQLLGGRSF